ncbi:MAG: hypothetical protein K940chlam3_01760, partial [Chlamydiae bacterium]|nr:hypothetical protein [Chlamydiota bacterium]
RAIAEKVFSVASMRGCSSDGAARNHFYNALRLNTRMISHIDPHVFMRKLKENLLRQSVQYAEVMLPLSFIEEYQEILSHVSEKGPKLKFIIEIDRDHEVTGDLPYYLKHSVKYMKKYPNIVGISLNGQEDGKNASLLFPHHTEAIKRIWEKNQELNFSLQAGQFNPTSISYEGLKTRLGKTLEAHPKRIGSGASIIWQEKALEVLRKMAKEKVCIEIDFSSDKYLVGEEHPISLFDRYHIPVSLNSSYPAITHQDQTDQFLEVFLTQKYDYLKLKQLARNSLEFSFLEGVSIFLDRDTLKLASKFEGVDTCAWKDTVRDLSEKGREQVKLERALVEFESWVIENFSDLLGI